MNDQNNSDNLMPIRRQMHNEILIKASAQSIEFLVDKLGEIYLKGKELENRRLEIETIQLEIMHHYDTERTRLLEVFKERKDMRLGIERMLEKAIEDDNHEMKLIYLDIYREYISSLNFDSRINQFSKRSGEDNITTIEI